MSIADWSMDLAPRQEKERKLFSPEQANRTLVLVRRIVGDVTNEYQHLMDLEELIEAAEEGGHRGPLEEARQKLVSCVDKLQDCLSELDEVGVELRDFARGIVSFPSVRDGRPIVLSWMLGELEVEFWCEPEESFASRKPIEKNNEAILSETV